MPQREEAGSLLKGMRPCIAIVPIETAQPASPTSAQDCSGLGGDALESAGLHGQVQLYTLRTHSVVQTLQFSSRVLSIRASCRLLIVALDAQACAVSFLLAASWKATPARCCRANMSVRRQAAAVHLQLC
jgi:hypothetical protein